MLLLHCTARGEIGEIGHGVADQGLGDPWANTNRVGAFTKSSHGPKIIISTESRQAPRPRGNGKRQSLQGMDPAAQEQEG